MYIADQGLKIASILGMKNVDTITLKKGKRFFVFYQRKEGVITKYVFKCMIGYYIINITGFTALLLQIIFGDSFFMLGTSIILGSANVILLPIVSSQPALSFVQKCQIQGYLGKERARRKERNRSAKINIWFILMFPVSWLTMFFISYKWVVMEFMLITWKSNDSYVSLVYLIPICYCVIVGYVFTVLINYKGSSEISMLSKPFIAWKAIIWLAPAIALALWSPLYLVILSIPSHPPYFDGSYYPDFTINCGVVVGIIIGSFRNMKIGDIEDNTRLLPAVLKAFIFSAVYFILFYLSSMCVQSFIMKLYGYTNYGFGAYWVTAGNTIFFGILLGVMFRIPRFSLQSRWVYRANNSFIWVIIFAILVALVGLAWEVFIFNRGYIPSFISPRDRIPDIAVIWMFLLGYLLGRNIEQVEEKNRSNTKRGRFMWLDRRDAKGVVLFPKGGDSSATGGTAT